jgi:hypothetical protein
VRFVSVGRGATFLTGIAVLAGVLVVVVALWPVLVPLTQRTTLAGTARWTGVGIPVPEVAHRCTPQSTVAQSTVADWGRWCLPRGVSAATLAHWYDDVLPAGRDAGDLRWCVQTWQSDGGRRSLWSSGDALVGYVLPPEDIRLHVPTVAVNVVVLPGSACPSAARADREHR